MMSSDLATELSALRAMVEAQQERAEAQQARIDELERAATARGSRDEDSSSNRGPISRRALFGAGAGIVGATVLGSAAPAAAADGEAVLIGRDNTTSAETQTLVEHTHATTQGGSTFEVLLNNSVAPADALSGKTTGSGYGVRGDNTNLGAGSGGGVYGQSISSSGVGVWGYNGNSGIGVQGSSAAGIGVGGFTSSTGPAVYGSSSSVDVGAGAGVEGEAESGHGVVGRSGSGFGVEAASTSSFGVNAFSVDDSAINADNGNAFPTIKTKNGGAGAAIDASSDSGVGIAVTSSAGPIGLLAVAEGPGPAVAGVFDASLGAGIRMTPRNDLTGPPTSGTYLIGSQIVDSLGDVYTCTTSGVDGGVWAKLNTAPGVTFLAAPERAYDSRPGEAGPGIKSKIAAGTTRVVDLTAATAVPVGAVAAYCNVTITGTEGGGFVSVYSADEPTATPPSFASVNSFASGQTIGNNVQTALSTTGDVKVYASRSVHVIIDVVAFIA